MATNVKLSWRKGHDSVSQIQYLYFSSFQLACITSGGRYTLHLQRSLAMFHAASADSPKSTLICRMHILRGLPLGRRHWCLLLSLRPEWASTSRRRAARVPCSGSQRTWSNTDMRRLSLVWFSTAAFVTKSYHCIPSIHRWQVMWKASGRRSVLDLFEFGMRPEHENMFSTGMEDELIPRWTWATVLRTEKVFSWFTQKPSGLPSDSLGTWKVRYYSISLVVATIASECNSPRSSSRNFFHVDTGKVL